MERFHRSPGSWCFCGASSRPAITLAIDATTLMPATSLGDGDKILRRKPAGNDMVVLRRPTEAGQTYAEDAHQDVG
jgi:hypothetical protein